MNSIPRYTFTSKKLVDIIYDNKVLIYFDEQESIETVDNIDEESKTITQEYPIWSYRRVESSLPLDKNKIIHAINKEEFGWEGVEELADKILDYLS